MMKLRLAVVGAVTGVFLLSSGSLAHAADPYPVTTPVPTVAPEGNGILPDEEVAPGSEAGTDDGIAPDEASAPDDNGILPGTGGVALALVLAGGLLVVAGGTAVHASRRRHISAY